MKLLEVTETFIQRIWEKLRKRFKNLIKNTEEWLNRLVSSKMKLSQKMLQSIKKIWILKLIRKKILKLKVRLNKRQMRKSLMKWRSKLKKKILQDSNMWFLKLKSRNKSNEKTMKWSLMKETYSVINSLKETKN